jgi:uncharacterized membrane protein (DUF106 family)
MDSFNDNERLEKTRQIMAEFESKYNTATN